MRARLRGLFPPSGKPYELFDTAWLVLALGILGYVITDPPVVTRDALAPLRFITETQLGYILAGAGLFGVACSYSTRLLRAGYIVTMTAAGVMSLNFFLGFIGSLVDGDHSYRLLLSCILYGWIVSRLVRDNREVR